MFSDLNMLPNTFKWILLIIPYTHSILASKAAFLGQYIIVLRSIAYITGFTIVVLYIAAKIFSTERIITSKLTTVNIKNIFKRNNKKN
jgi:ABC-2 type transport system permease protein